MGEGGGGGLVCGDALHEGGEGEGEWREGMDEQMSSRAGWPEGGQDGVVHGPLSLSFSSPLSLSLSVPVGEGRLGRRMAGRGCSCGGRLRAREAAVGWSVATRCMRERGLLWRVEGGHAARQAHGRADVVQSRMVSDVGINMMLGYMPDVDARCRPENAGQRRRHRHRAARAHRPSRRC